MGWIPGDWAVFDQWAIWRFLFEGLWISVRIAGVSILLSLVIGVVMAVGRLSPVPAARFVATGYIETFRATPLLLLITFVFFGAGRLNTGWANGIPVLTYFFDDVHGDLTPEASGVLALTLYNSAIVAEIVRAGIASIPRGVIEASRTLGLGYLQSMRYVAVPMALRRMAPGLVSQLITLFKDTSLVALIAVLELSRRARILYDSPAYSQSTVEILFVVALMYFVPNYLLSLLAGRLERGPEARAGLDGDIAAARAAAE
jgi:putative glutamine transport system permease protein